MLTAVRTDRQQLEAAHAVQAAIATGCGGGAQPRLAAAGAIGAEQPLCFVHRLSVTVSGKIR